MKIADALDTYLLHTEEDRPPDGFYHPSSLFQCDRLAVYEQRGIERSDAKKKGDHRPLVMGTLLHELLQSAVTHQVDIEAIQEAWHEVKVFIPTLGVKGSADSLVLWNDGTYEVEEFKSIKTSAVKFRGGGVKNFEPKPNHIAQGLTYVHGIKYFPWFTEHIGPDGKVVKIKHKPLGEAMSRLRLTYILKDDMEPLEFLYIITPEWEEWFVKYIKGLRATPEGVLPPRKPEKDWLCNSYCAYRTRCWGGGDE